MGEQKKGESPGGGVCFISCLKEKYHQAENGGSPEPYTHLAPLKVNLLAYISSHVK